MRKDRGLTPPLSERTARCFARSLVHYGPLNIPDIETKAIEFQNKGWQLQRVLDRLAGHEHKPYDAEFEALEDDMHGIIDWFALEHKELKGMFTKYLANA